MEHGRVVSSVSEAWGHGTVYTHEPAESVHSAVAYPTSQKSLHQTVSSISEVVAELMVPEPVTLVPIEGLSFLLSSLFATVLEDIMAQLWCLERCNNELRISKTLFDIGRLKAIKYGVLHDTDCRDDLEGVDPHNLNCMIYKINKLDADRKYLTSVVVSTYLNLAECFSFHPLVNYIKEIEDRDSYRLLLQEEEAKNKILRKELRSKLRQLRNHITSVLYDTDVTIDRLKTEVEDSILYSETRGRYVDNWQRARTEQHDKTIFNTEDVSASEIEYYKQRTDHENRVHNEVELLVNIAVNETLTRIEEWMDKYDKDIEGLDLKIQIKKNDYQNMRDKRMELEKTIERHDEQIKAWNTFKEEREKARKYHELMTNSAIIVQAWWRGLLVRLELGPYRVKKPKKGLDAKKKKY